jgi:hypothetical protein
LLRTLQLGNRHENESKGVKLLCSPWEFLDSNPLADELSYKSDCGIRSNDPTIDWEFKSSAIKSGRSQQSKRLSGNCKFCSGRIPSNHSIHSKLIMPWKTITRKELYDEVWSTPVSKLALKYNLSDVGFAKFCKRCDIPRPPRGYWAKLEAGQKVKRTPLPKHDEQGEIKVHVPEPGEVEAKEKARVETEKRENLLPKIEVAESLRGCHRLVSAANDTFEGAKKRDDGLLHTPEGCQLDLLVSRDQLRRSLLVLSALLKAFESLGHKVSSGPKIEVNGQAVTLTIREATKTVEVEFEASKESITGHYDFFSERKRKKQVPSCLLTVLVPEADSYWASGCRKQWKDAKTQRIENCLNSIVAGVLEIAEKKKEHEIKQEQEAIKRVEDEKRQRQQAAERAKKREEQKQEQRKLDGLLAQASDLRRSREIREFIAYVRQVHESKGSKIDVDSELGKYLAWAELQANRLDPTINSPNTILDEVIPDESTFSSYRRW